MAAIRAYIRRADWSRDLDWARTQVPLVFTEDMVGFVAETLSGERVGLVAFSCFTHSHAVLDMALRFAATRAGLMEVALGYAFGARGLTALHATIAETNTKCLSLAHRLGAVEYHRIVEGFAAGVDFVCVELKKEHVNFLTKKGAADVRMG